LTATPGSNSNNNNNNTATNAEHESNPKLTEDAACGNDESCEDSIENDDETDSITNRNKNVATRNSLQNEIKPATSRQLQQNEMGNRVNGHDTQMTQR